MVPACSARRPITLGSGTSAAAAPALTWRTKSRRVVMSVARWAGNGTNVTYRARGPQDEMATGKAIALSNRETAFYVSSPAPHDPLARATTCRRRITYRLRPTERSVGNFPRPQLRRKDVARPG